MLSQSVIMPEREGQQDILDITSDPIKDITYCGLSINRRKTLICTTNGFCLVNNATKTFKRFQKQKNPFASQKNGISIGSIIDERTQVAIVPIKNTKSFKKTSVYIFDYKIKDILYENDFFLPIRQITLTDQSIVVSNNKRIIIYDYDNDVAVKDQRYYLNMYQEQKPNNFIRYIEMNCEQKFSNNSLKEDDDREQEDEEIEDLTKDSTPINECKCGKYEISYQKPYKILYSKVYTINKVKRISLAIYDWAIDKSYVIESLNDQDPFTFSISGDGKYMAYSQEEGRKIKVLTIGQAGVLCTLWVSRSLKNPLCGGFLQLKGHLWFCMTRDIIGSGNMHLFKIENKKQGEFIESQYKRSFSLYEKTLKQYRVHSKRTIDFYEENQVVYCLSVCGVVHDIIDFKRSGHHPKKFVQNFIKWAEEEPSDSE